MPRILSIDGGGIRGIVAAVVLAELEQRVGRPIADCFDLIAGTSTGGIIALALTRPAPDGRPSYSAQDLVGFYSELGPWIFERSPSWAARTIGSLAGPKYDSDRLAEALEDQFGDTLISAALRDVLITSYDIERREPFFFKSHFARVRQERDFRMRDAALATAAGPTYFAPVRVLTDDTIGYRALVDGGVYANNPAMCAWVEALSLFGAPPLQEARAATGQPIEVTLAPRPAPLLGTATTLDPVPPGAPLPPDKPRPDRPPTAGRAVVRAPSDPYPYRPVVDTWDAEWLVVSVGTGRSEREIPYAKARGWGLAKWAPNIIDIVFDGVSDTVDYQMRQVLATRPDQLPRYYRFQSDLAGAKTGLGDADPANVRRLEKAGYTIVKRQARELAEVVARVG